MKEQMSDVTLKARSLDRMILLWELRENLNYCLFKLLKVSERAVSASSREIMKLDKINQRKITQNKVVIFRLSYVSQGSLTRWRG